MITTVPELANQIHTDFIFIFIFQTIFFLVLMLAIFVRTGRK